MSVLNLDKLASAPLSSQPFPLSRVATVHPRRHLGHAHARCSGSRRAMQPNGVTEAGVVRREQARHRLSSRLKRLNPVW